MISGQNFYPSGPISENRAILSHGKLLKQTVGSIEQKGALSSFTSKEDLLLDNLPFETASANICSSEKPKAGSKLSYNLATTGHTATLKQTSAIDEKNPSFSENDDYEESFVPSMTNVSHSGTENSSFSFPNPDNHRQKRRGKNTLLSPSVQPTNPQA